MAKLFLFIIKHIVELFLSFILLILLASCIYMFYIQIKSQPQAEKWDYYYYHRDSLYMNAFNRSSGISLRDMKARLDFMEKQQSDLIADLRQETNSNIDKMNAWLGFWIAVLAVLCAIIPILIQYRIYRESKNQIKSLRKQIDEQEQYLQLNEQLYGLRVNYQNSIFADDINREKFSSYLITSIVKYFNTYINIYSESGWNLTKEEREKLLVLFVRLMDIIDLNNLRLPVRSPRRGINNLRNTIRNIILYLSNIKFCKEDFLKSINTFSSQLNNLPGWLDIGQNTNSQ